MGNMDLWPPSVAFYFKVEFTISSDQPDIAFKEVSGLSSELETEEVKEGGENRFRHRLPVRGKHPNLVCKRALVPLKQSTLSQWIKKSVENDFDEQFKTSSVFISLMDANGTKMAGWYLTNAFPVKWEISSFNAQKNELVIETLEFVYNTIERKM